MRNVAVRPVRDLRNRYAEIEEILERHDPVIITKNGRGTAVLMNIEDYAKIEEYQHILYVEGKLKEAEAEAESPDVELVDYKTVFEHLKKTYHGL
ncbi:MAG: type II toxin-antitoxin system Phd/YefM family antitoxin [Treponema sp.]|jgi:prevent-host-death family protein|nr:type II toxin-antitoxin system Phd/YefM family antitoxin [Treponema sp.]